MRDLRNRIPPSGPFVVDNNPRPIIGTGGDQSQAQDVVAPGSTTALVTSVLDTTGTDIAGMILFFTACVELASTVALAQATFDVLLDGVPLAPPIGGLVQANVTGAAPVQTIAFSGTLPLTRGPNTVQIRCTTDANTTATVNPGGTQCRTATYLFFKL